MLRLTAPLQNLLRLIGSAVGFGGRLIADFGVSDPNAAISRAPEPKPEPISRRGLRRFAH